MSYSSYYRSLGEFGLLNSLCFFVVCTLTCGLALIPIALYLWLQPKTTYYNYKKTSTSKLRSRPTLLVDGYTLEDFRNIKTNE